MNEYWPFFLTQTASQSNALDELVNMACLLVDTINEMSGAPVHLSPLSSTDLTYLFHWLGCITISFEQDGKC